MAYKFYKGDTPLIQQPRLGNSLLGRAYVGNELAYGAAAGFDPTLGGTLSPYYWFDFTDSSTMVFSSGVNISTITSKGSNTGNLSARSNQTTNPTYQTTYSSFAGGSGANSGLQILDSSLPAELNNDDFTIILLANVDMSQANSLNNRPLSYIVPSGTMTSPVQWDIFPAYDTIPNFPQTKNIDTGVQGNPANTPNMYGGYYNAADYYNHKNFTNGTTETGWNAMMLRYTASTKKQEFGLALDSSNLLEMNSVMQTYESSTGTGLTLGARALSSQTDGADMDVAHLIYYGSKLTDTNIDDILGGFTAP